MRLVGEGNLLKLVVVFFFIFKSIIVRIGRTK